VRIPTVLQVVPSLDLGGAERATVDVAAALAAAGWRSLVASAGGRLVRELERAGARHVELPLDAKNPFALRRNAGRLADLMLAERVGLVHARSRAPAWSALAAARRTGARFVTTVHGVYPANLPLKHRYNRVMARGDRVIAVSAFVAEHLRARYGLGDDRLRLVPRGIDLAVFDPARVSAERMIALARRWALPDGAPVILLPGRPARLKGHGVLIEALARLARPDALALLVGFDGARPGYRRELERASASAGLGGRVRLIDACADMPAAYMLADVVVSASIVPEAFGRVAVEAQAMGRPVVATDHGASRETVAPGETGWLVPPRDAAALARAVDQALGTGEAERLALAERGRARALQLFDKTTMCARTLAVYAELLGGAAPAMASAAAR
jgi:glycosyltransferase involved in cell wall biosynthesis